MPQLMRFVVSGPVVFGAWALLSFAGCGDDDGAESTGGTTSGSSHGGGKTTGGAGGSPEGGAAAGSTSAPEAGESAGGNGAAAGEAGHAPGGDAGSAGAAGQGGSGGGGGMNGGAGQNMSGAGGEGGADPLLACHSCEQQKCATEAAACDVAGVKCRALLDCVSQSGCGTGSQDQGIECYCGQTDIDSCVSATDPSVPQGVCKVHYEAAAGTNVPVDLTNIFSDYDSALGKSTKVIDCYQAHCADECNL